MRQSKEHLSSKEFLSKIPSAIDQVTRNIVNSDFTMIDAIASDPETLKLLDFIEDETAELLHIPKATRDKAALVEVGIRAGVELAAADRVTVDARNVRVFWRDKAMLAIGACAAFLIWTICSDHVQTWRIVGVLAAASAIAGLVFRVGRDSTARSFAMLLTSGRR